MKAKQKLKTFTESVFNYANSLSFPVEEIHFGLSGGDVIDQLRDVTLASKPSLVLLGPKDEASDDYSAGVVRKVLHHIDCPILSLPLRDEVTGELPGRIVYISEDDKKLDEHLSLITDVFGNEVEIETLTANTELDGELLDYLVKTKTSIVVVDKPKTGAIGALFNKDLSDKMMKQENIPVLFLD